MTTLIEKVVTQIDTNVSDLTGRVEEVADLAELVRQKALPQRSPASYVIPVGLNGQTADAVTGLFRQWLGQVVGVVLIAEALGDPKAKAAQQKIDVLVMAVIKAVAGWIPVADAGDTSVYGEGNVLRGRLISVNAGVVIYQLDFQFKQQIRITRT